MSGWNGSIVVAVGAVVQDPQGRVLLVKHVPQRGGFWQGRWICPGGRLERGESIAEGIAREVWEETGLRIELREPLTPFERIVPGEEGDTQLHVIYIDHLARVVGGALRPGDDVGEATWLSVEDIRARWDELHEDTQRLLHLSGLLE